MHISLKTRVLSLMASFLVTTAVVLLSFDYAESKAPAPPLTLAALCS